MSVLSVFRFLLVFVLVACSSNVAPVTHYGVSDGAGSVGAHVVMPGDTLYSIAQRYNMRSSDIQILNEMAPPYTISVGERLTLPAPKTYRMRVGDTLYFLSYMFDVDVEETAALNGIADPLHVEVGRVLNLPALGASSLVEDAVIVRDEDGVPKPGAKPLVRKASVKTAKIHVDTPQRSSSKFLSPVEGRIVSGYGPKANGLHNDGVNILAARGTPVKAAENGVVVYAGNGLKGSGNLILVRHEDRWMTAYGHLADIGIKSGDVVKRGQAIGSVGSSGAVNSPQLHFEVRRGTKALNPKPYLE